MLTARAKSPRLGATRIRRCVAAAGLAAWCVALAGTLTPDATSAPHSLVVSVGGPAEDPAYLPVHAAAALGTFEAEGVAVTLRRAKHPTGALDLLRTREAAIATTTLDQAIRGAWARDMPVRVVVAHVRAPAAVLVVSATTTARITRLADLRGQKLAIPGPGTTGHHVLLHLLDAADIAPWQTDLQSFGGPALLARLAAGDVGAAMVDEPWAGRALEARAGLALLDLRQPQVAEQALGGPFYEVVSVTPAGRPEGKKPDKGVKPGAGPTPLQPPPDAALAAFTRAIIRVQAWLRTTAPAEVAERLPPALVGEREQFLARLEALRAAYVADGEATAKGLTASLAVLKTGSPWPVSLHLEAKDLQEPAAVTAARASLGSAPSPP